MNQQPMISISIPVKPHVKKYMSFRYGNEHTFSKNSLLGILLIHVLDKKVPKSNFVFKDYKENYPILISEQYYYRHGCEIPLKKRRYLALCLEKIFTEDLHLFIDFGMSEFSLSAAECIRKFFKKYEITENEVKYESVYRSFQRYKSENNLKKTNN
jgi:hypothetical protein